MKSNLIKDEIDSFFEYFDGEISTCLKQERRLYKKILIVVMLDTLSLARYPKKDNHDRYIGLINNYADWIDCRRVCLPQLSLMLQDRNKHDSKLALEVLEQLSKWKKGTMYETSSCPLNTGLIPLALNKEETAIIKKAQFSELLYLYRNHLVHNYKEPAYGIEEEGDKEPFHHSMQKNNKGTEMGGLIKSTWELVFPLDFFEICIRNCLNNLKKYFEQENKSPYDSYSFDTMWLLKK